jgi:undecaprenyl-diphosphatase
MFGAFAAGWLIWSLRAGMLAMVWAIVVVCFPRVYLGYHYFSDIMAGMILGSLVIWMCFKTNLIKTFVKRIREFEESYPTIFYPGYFLMTSQLSVMFIDIRNTFSVLIKIYKGIVDI